MPDEVTFLPEGLTMAKYSNNAVNLLVGQKYANKAYNEHILAHFPVNVFVN